MSILLAKLLILKMLFDDDEPLNLILEETIINDDNKYLLQEPFLNQQIETSDVKKAIKELKNGEMIILLNDTGEKLEYNELEKIFSSSEEWKYWFRITQEGKRFFNDNYNTYFHAEYFR